MSVSKFASYLASELGVYRFDSHYVDSRERECSGVVVIHIAQIVNGHVQGGGVVLSAQVDFCRF